MKKRPSLTILVSALMLLNSGCGGSPSSSPSPSPSGSPSPGSPTPSVSPSPSPQAAVPPAPTASPADLSVLGLIPSTKPNQRRQEILAGRTNPFALIPVEATIRQTVCVAPKPPKPEEVAMAAMRAQSSSSSSGQANGGKKKATAGTQIGKTDKADRTVAEAPSVNLPNPSSLFGNQAETPTDSSGKAPIPTVTGSANPAVNGLKTPRVVISKTTKSVIISPKLRGKPSAILAKAASSPIAPEMTPTEANAVEVSGVMTIGSKPFAIVKAPGEPVARYVGVGSRLSNGAVRVSGINTGLDNPGITVEQYGVSVFREVGQASAGTVPVEGTEKNKSPVVPTLNYYRTISPKARSLYGGAGHFLSLPTQFLAQLPGLDNRELPTFEAVPKGPRSVALTPPDASGFGEVRSLSLLALKIQIGGGLGSTKSTGIICNTGKTPIKVGDLTLQLEDKTSNTILDSMVINFPKNYSLKYGQKLEFDGNIPDFRGRSLKNLTVKLVDWSSGKP